MHKFTLSMLVTICCFSVAHADIGKVGGAIGKVGSPVVPSNAHKSPDKGELDNNPPNDESAAAVATVERTPILTIPFAQRRVNFERNLDETIIRNEKAAPGTNYDVIATIPSANQSVYLNDIYQSNLSAVVQEMQRVGVSPERIHSSTILKEGATGEEVSVYSGQ